jgi:hypothetical protein
VLKEKASRNAERLVIRIGFKPMTPNLEGLCSIQLSYRTNLKRTIAKVNFFSLISNSIYIHILAASEIINDFL